MDIPDPNTVYVTIGRACGKTRIQNEMIEALIKSGKKVVFVKPKPWGKQTKGVTYSGVVTDLDILSPERMERAEAMLKQILKGE